MYNFALLPSYYSSMKILSHHQTLFIYLKVRGKFQKFEKYSSILKGKILFIFFFPSGLTATLVEHLSQQLESYKSELSSKLEHISVLQTELADKEDVIKEQLDTITDYREEMVRLGDNTYDSSYCPVLETKRKARRTARRSVKRKRTRLEPCGGQDKSLESDSWSEPEVGVSLARIGLPLSFPELSTNCNCDRNLLSESDDKQSKSKH